MDQYICRTESVKNGDVILKEDSWAYYAYVLLSGTANVWKTINGKSILVGKITQGEIFGVMSFFVQAKRTATIIAEGDAKVGMIARDTFMDMINKLPKEIRENLTKLRNDICLINDVNSRLINCLPEISIIKSGIIDTNLFVKKTDNMPNLLQNVVTQLGRRFKSAVEESKKLLVQLDEESKSITALAQ